MGICDVILENAYYRAEICSADGGNCYRLYEKAHGAELLRTPHSEDALNAARCLYGTPLLFPANRIRGGCFPFLGRTYTFPINEPETGCHLHGDLHRTPFEVCYATETEARLRVEFDAMEYQGFLHAFCVTRLFLLTEEGLCETLIFENRSDAPMPLMTAYHTTFCIPMTKDGDPSDYRLTLLVAEEHKRDLHHLPTCEYEAGARSEVLRQGTFSPSDGQLTSAFFRAAGDTVLLSDRKARLRARYTVSGFSYWMLYNGGSREFVCVEPQTNAIDAFHIDKSPDEAGVITVPAGGTHILKTKLLLEAF
jgi:aldose 1-epimerase